MLIEPASKGHKAVERKRLPLSRSLEDHVPLFRGNPGSCEELPGFLSFEGLKGLSLRAVIEMLSRCPSSTTRGLGNLRASTTPPPPHPTPRYTRPHGYQHTRHSNARCGRANGAQQQARPRSRARRGSLCPVALGPHAPGQRVQLPVRVAFGPQPGRQHRAAHRGPGRPLQAPRACRPTDRRPGLAGTRVGRRPLLPARSPRPVRERLAPIARRRPHLSLLLHARRAPHRKRTARQRRHAHLPRRLPKPFCQRNRPPQRPARPGHASARAHRR